MIFNENRLAIIFVLFHILNLPNDPFWLVVVLPALQNMVMGCFTVQMFVRLAEFTIWSNILWLSNNYQSLCSRLTCDSCKTCSELNLSSCCSSTSFIMMACSIPLSGIMYFVATMVTCDLTNIMLWFFSFHLVQRIPHFWPLYPFLYWVLWFCCKYSIYSLFPPPISYIG